MEGSQPHQPGYAAQSTHDYVIAGERWEGYLAMKLSPLICDMFMHILQACEAVADERSEELVDEKHRKKAVLELFTNTLKGIDYATDPASLQDVARIVRGVPDLMDAFKAFFIAYVFVLTSVQLWQTSGAPVLQTALPSDSDIVINVIQVTSARLIAKPKLILKHRSLVETVVKDSMHEGLVMTIQSTDVLSQYLRRLREERMFNIPLHQHTQAPPPPQPPAPAPAAVAVVPLPVPVPEPAPPQPVVEEKPAIVPEPEHSLDLQGFPMRQNVVHKEVEKGDEDDDPFQDESIVDDDEDEEEDDDDDFDLDIPNFPKGDSEEGQSQIFLDDVPFDGEGDN